LDIKPNFWGPIKNVILFIGFIYGFLVFWKGFGIGICSNENDSYWVMNYVYWSLWPIIPLVIVSRFFPWLGGLAFISNAFWSSYLVYQVWFNKISFVTSDNIFVVYHGKYNIWLTEFSGAVPMIVLGIAFLFIGWKEKSMAYAGKKIGSA
jgi:hypothetical protein